MVRSQDYGRFYEHLGGMHSEMLIKYYCFYCFMVDFPDEVFNPGETSL